MDIESLLGQKRAKAIRWAIGEAKTGTRQVGVEFELLDVEGCPHMTWYGFFTDKALATTVKALRACGWEGCDLEQLDGLDRNEVQLVIEPETDDAGQRRARIRWVNSAGGLAMGTALAGNDLKGFAAKMRGAILALDPSNASRYAANKPAPKPASGQRQAQNGPAAPEPPPVGDDDMPF